MNHSATAVLLWSDRLDRCVARSHRLPGGLPGPVLAADSVTGGAWAAWSGTPIVLTPTDSVHPAVEAFLAADVGAPVLATAGTTNPPETLAAVAGCGGQVQLRSLGPIGSGLLAELDAQDEASC